MEVGLCMKSGEGETSYANSSLPPRAGLYKTKPFLEEAIRLFFSTNTVPKTMNIADLGCSLGPNSFLPTTIILDTIHDWCKSSKSPSPEFQIFLNDLPENDFNTLFKNIQPFIEKLLAEKGDEFGPCLFYGCPGSFYERLFPNGSMHFVSCATSLQWLSQVPPELRGEKGDFNKGNVALGKTSPYHVFEVYLDQFKRDFNNFLKSRAPEIVPGGGMVLTLLGRRTVDPYDEDYYSYYDILAHSLKDMVEEGIVEEKKMDSFNFPLYEPYVDEVGKIIEEEGSFNVIKLEQVDRVVDNFVTAQGESSKMFDINVLTNCMRSVTDPVLSNHFGPSLNIDDLFNRFREKLWPGWKKSPVFLIASLSSVVINQSYK